MHNSRSKLDLDGNLEGGEEKRCAGGGIVGAPFPDPPSFQGSHDGDPRRANGGEVGGLLWYPNKKMAQNDPHDALIILGYVSWGKYFLNKNPSGPFCGASGESSTEFLDQPLWTGLSREPLSQPPPPLLQGAQTTAPPRANLFSLCQGGGGSRSAINSRHWASGYQPTDVPQQSAAQS